MFRLLVLTLLLGSQFALSAQNADTDKRVEALLAKMTLAEKIGQLNQVPGDITTGTDVKKDNMLNQIRAGQVGSVLSHLGFENKIMMQRVATTETRLGIPILFGFDVIHGYKTIFPIPLAQAASWDLAAIEAAERTAATEAAADGQHWTFSPMVDVSRDPRWGRVMEGSGEDTYLGSRIAQARVRGFQGTDLSLPTTVAACTKHFAGYGFGEAGRDYNTVDVSEQRLREFILPPFKAAADAGSVTFMNAFNTLNGTPASMNKFLITRILRGEWGWNGMVVSDWNSFGETIVHGAAADDEDAAAKCLVAGSDMDMVSGVFQRGLEKALKDGRVRQDQIDEAVRRVLRLKFQLGLFDDPFRYLDPKRRASTLERADFRQQSRELAAKSMVLLKNEQNVLPLNGKGPIKKIAIVGPYADSRSDKDYLSFWTGAIGVDYDASKVVTAAQGLKPALEALGYQVTVVQLCATGDCGEADFAAAVKATQAADLVIGCVGEHGNDCGESRCVSDLNLSRQQESLLKALHRGGKPVVMVLFNSRPLTFEWARQNLPAILVAWQPGYEAGNAVADVLTGKVNPAGKLPMTFPRSVGQVPLYYNHFNTGRPQEKYPTMWTSGYLDLTSEPAWPFGFGLSYTTFTYSDIRLDKSKIGLEETLVARVTVTNSGSVAGQEVVQLYTRDLTADVTRPLRELKAFEKISLRPGESKEVVLRVDARDLGYYNGDLVFKTDPGKFKVFVGGSSANTKEADFEVGK